MLPRLSLKHSVADIPSLLEEAERLGHEIAGAKSEVVESIAAERLGELIDTYERMQRASWLASTIANLLFDLDSNSVEARKWMNVIDQRLTEVSSTVLFFTLALKRFPSERLEELRAELPQYQAWIRKLGRYAPYTLSEPEEQVITYKGAAQDALIQVYETLTGNFTFTFTYEGEEITVNQAGLTPYIVHRERAVRKAASEALRERFDEYRNALGDIYGGLVVDYDRETVSLRKYESPIAARHEGNDLPADAYEALLSSVHKHRHIFTRYIELKRKALGYDEFTRYDFAAPVPGKPESIEWSDSVARVDKAFNTFAPWFADAARSVLTTGHIDAEPRLGKRGGAACYALPPGEIPAVIMNHTGSYEDAFTLAHELGHAVHDICAGEQSLLQFHPPLVLAETASTWAELLLMDEEKRRLGSDATIALLCHQIDDASGSIMAQMRYTEFEREAHERLLAGGGVDELHERWAALLREYFPTVEWPEESVTWLAIPHLFRSPFYCYSYSFGALLVYALWQRHLLEPDFAERFRSMLASGASKPPAQLLAELGYDITSEAFWDGGFATIQGWVDELERLLG